VRWANFGTLTPSGKPEKHGRDQLYAQYLSERTLMDPLNASCAWLRALRPDWPAPYDELVQGKVWQREDVIAWIAKQRP